METYLLWFILCRSDAILLHFQVQVGREKEAILDMLPYLRLGYVSDPSEMQSVISSQGPVCPVSLGFNVDLCNFMLSISGKISHAFG